MNRRHAARLMTGILAVGLTVTGLGATSAHGAIAHDRVVSADPVDTTPQIIGEKVRRVAPVDGVHVAVGEFETVKQNNGQTFARHNIVAFDDAGNVSTTFNPIFNGSELWDVIPSGDGSTVYVAGAFSTVNGVNQPRVVRLNVHTGARVNAFRPQGINNHVRALILDNGVLYAGGKFTRVGGVDRPGLVALDPASGLDTGKVALPVTGTWNGGVTSVDKMTIKPDGSKLVFIGNFRYVAGQYRPQIAMLDLAGNGTASLSSWHTNGYAKTCSRTFETYMYDVDSDPTGSYFVAVTTGAYSGGPGAGTLCDAAARWEWGASGPNQNPTWVEYSGGDTFTAVEVTGEAVYVGGHFRWMNNPYAADRAGAGAVSRKGLAALEPRNGLPLSWNPGRLRGWGVWGFNADSTGLWIGHDTTTVGGELHENIARFPLAGGTVKPAEITGSLPGELVLLGTTDARGLTFNGTSVTANRTFTSNANWSTARAPFMIDNRVYYGLSDGTFKSRSFNGNSFGAQSGHNIYKDTSWSNDLKVITAAAYDRVQGRLYYTLAGSSTLYYRYFSVENKLTGAMRFTASTTGTGISWSSVTGMVFANGALWVRDSGGTLRRLGWDNGPTGAATAVSGPGIDGVDWASRLMFLRTS